LQRRTTPEYRTKSKVKDYCTKHTGFLRVLLAVLQLAGRQPAQGLEPLSLKIFNTASSQYNIFIYKDRPVHCPALEQSARVQK